MLKDIKRRLFLRVQLSPDFLQRRPTRLATPSTRSCVWRASNEFHFFAAIFDRAMGPSHRRRFRVALPALLCFVLEILLGGKQRKQSFRTERLAESWQTGDRKFTDDEKSTQRSEIGRDSNGSCLKWPINWFHSWWQTLIFHYRYN